MIESRKELKVIMSKTIKLVITIILSILVGGVLSYFIFNKSCDNNSSLPKPEITEGIRGTQFGIDKNIYEETIDNYLDRSDSVYRDMRMLKDPGNYEAIGGDAYLSGFVRGFEVVPYPYLVNVTGLPEEVGKTYEGETLFTEKNGKYTANYAESLEILEYLFPKDKNIFLMCGGGGYAGMTKNLLISLGWDKDKIYNVGGFWYYKGKNKINVKNTSRGSNTYDFYKIAYHDIDFDNLTKIK
jgi:hypothetical protein